MDDYEAIRQLKARYFRCMDTKDWDAMRNVFVPDVHIDMENENGGIHDDVESFMSMLIANIGGVTTVHHGHMPEIDLTSLTTATGIWAMEDTLRWPNGMEMHGHGHYHETYVKLADGWRIESMRLDRLRVDFTPGPDGS
jgi:hypothetical protein